MRRMSGPAAFLTVLALAFTLAACDSDEDGGADGPGTMSVQGHVQKVEARSLLEIGSLTVRDRNGRDWVIDGGGTDTLGFSPSLVREHMVLGQPVTVFFHRDGDVLVLDDITESPTSVGPGLDALGEGAIQ